jgi:hypothetical protein
LVEKGDVMRRGSTLLGSHGRSQDNVAPRLEQLVIGLVADKAYAGLQQ